MSRLVDWLKGREGHEGVEPVKVTIGEEAPQTYDGASYTYRFRNEEQRQLYVLGARPAPYLKDSSVQFTAKEQHKSFTTGWYVQGYFDSTCELCKKAEVTHEQYRPFGNFFVLAIWEPRFGNPSSQAPMFVSRYF